MTNKEPPLTERSMAVTLTGVSLEKNGLYLQLDWSNSYHHRLYIPMGLSVDLITSWLEMSAYMLKQDENINEPSNERDGDSDD